MTTECTQEMQRLFTVEYGEMPEVAVRLTGVCLGGVLLFIYTGWPSAWLWSLGYVALHGINYTFLRARRDAATQTDCVIGGVLFLVLYASFLWMPAYMATTEDATLVFSGIVLGASTFAFMIRRSDTMLWMIFGEVAILSAMIIWVLLSKMTVIEGELAVFATMLVTVAMTAYMFQAVFIARKVRLEGEAAARRAAQEQKMAAIGQLAGGVAHDFNNVLTAIIGNLELYEALPDPDERDEVVREAHAAAKRAEAVVSHLLIYARKAPVRRRAVLLNAAVARTMQLAQRGIPARISWRFVPEGMDVEVRVDEMQLTTALINLVRNAADAIEDTGTVTLSTRFEIVAQPMPMADGSLLPPGRYARIGVADTGSGIPEQHLRRVLEPFYTTKPPGKGTGLGLSMVLGFARDAQGGLWLSSGRDGTEVAVYLPGSVVVQPHGAETENAAQMDGVS